MSIYPEVELLDYMVILFLIYSFIHSFIYGCVGLRCCVRAFSNCGEWGLLFVAGHGLLTVVAFLAAVHGL